MPFSCLLQAAPPPQPQPSFGSSFLFLLLPLAVGYYFFIIKPMQRHRKEQEQMRSSVKQGDRILTTGGIYGTVAKLRDDRLFVRVAEGVQVELSKAAIASVERPDSAKTD